MERAGRVRRAFLIWCAMLLAAPLLPAPAGADEIRDAQWHVDRLDLATAHQVTRGAGVTVAMIDSGVDATHPDLRDALLPGIDLVDPGNENAWTPEEHGTLVAGVLGGQGHGPGSGAGVLGVAPDARILPIRASTGDDEGEQPTSHMIADAVTHAVAEGASVISISLGSDHSPVDERAIAAARREDVVVVAAAGNRPDTDAVTFPAALPSVVAVGGVDEEGEHAEFSVTGPELTLAAPGDEIITTLPGGQYAAASGTSLAAPIVAGAAALLRAQDPSRSAHEVVHRLIATAAGAGFDGHDERYGHGTVDIVAALTAQLPPPPPPPDEPDQTRRDQWHLEQLDVSAAHGVTQGTGVTVAIVGSGVDGSHPDLHHNVLPGVDLAQPDNGDAWTPGASATALAGIVAGHGNRLHDHAPGNQGVLGIAPAATVLPVRVTGGGTQLSDREAVELAAEGVEWAATNGADVILYAAGRASQDLFADAVAAAEAADAVLIAAAGGAAGTPSIWYPAAHPAVVAVAGVDQGGEPADDSAAGPAVALAAPGVELVTTAPDGVYTEYTGTAAAAGVVAGAAALVRAQDPSRPANDVVHRLAATAGDAGQPGPDERYGHGVINIMDALTADVPPPEPTPGAGSTTPGAGTGPAPVAVDLGPLAVAVTAAAATATTIGATVLIVLRVRGRRSRSVGTGPAWSSPASAGPPGDDPAGDSPARDRPAAPP